MAQPNYGEVRIVTNDGSGDDLASIYGLHEALVSSSLQGGGIVELATPIAKQYDQDESEIEINPCPTNPKCTVFVTINRNKGKVIAATKNGIRIPGECIECAGKRVLSAAGFITSTPRAIISTTEEV